MLNPFRRNSPPAAHTPPLPAIATRDTLFGDLPLEVWGKDNEHEPWRFFAEARRAIESGGLVKNTRAIVALRSVVATSGLESRHYLQAWTVLRQLGETAPPEEAKRVLGVVLEVSLKDGLDLLAAYADGGARYYASAGGGVVADEPSPEVKSIIDDLLAAAAAIVAKIGPWEKPRPPAPTGNSIRMSFLTPSGIHFGQGNMNVMSQEPMAGPVIALGIRLMKGLVEMSEKAKKR